MSSIPQYLCARAGHEMIRTYLTICPKCLSHDQGGFNYSTVDTPPISIQIDDNRKGITREWLAHRCCCSNCNHLWDVVTVNEQELHGPGERWYERSNGDRL